MLEIVGNSCREPLGRADPVVVVGVEYLGLNRRFLQILGNGMGEL